MNRRDFFNAVTAGLLASKLPIPKPRPGLDGWTIKTSWGEDYSFIQDFAVGSVENTWKGKLIASGKLDPPVPIKHGDEVQFRWSSSVKLGRM